MTRVLSETRQAAARAAGEPAIRGHRRHIRIDRGSPPGRRFAGGISDRPARESLCSSCGLWQAPHATAVGALIPLNGALSLVRTQGHGLDVGAIAVRAMLLNGHDGD